MSDDGDGAGGGDGAAGRRRARRTLTFYWDFGDVVFLAVRTGRKAGKVVGFNVFPSSIAYRVSWSDGSTTEHYWFELVDRFHPAADAGDDAGEDDDDDDDEG